MNLNYNPWKIKFSSSSSSSLSLSLCFIFLFCPNYTLITSIRILPKTRIDIYKTMLILKPFVGMRYLEVLK